MCAIVNLAFDSDILNGGFSDFIIFYQLLYIPEAVASG